MVDIVVRLRFDAARCETQFSKDVAGNIDEGVNEIERLRAALLECKYGAEYPDELGDIIDAALGITQQIKKGP
jgi:hypothetical protein